MQHRVSFQNRHGIKISGVLHVPDIAVTRAYALYAHCFTCTKSIKAAVTVCDTLERQGIATLRIDFTGLGGSKGSFSDSTFSTDVSDLIDAAAFLEAEYQAPELLVGHSLGGTATLAAAGHIESAKAVVSIGSPADPAHILHLLENHLNQLESEGEADVNLAGRSFSFKQEFVDDVVDYEIDYRNLGKALLVLHSPIDGTVNIDEAGKIFSSAMHPKSFVTLDNADHLLSKLSDAEYAAEVISAWVEKYLDPYHDSTATDNKHASVKVSANTKQGFLCRVEASGHNLAADEPLSMGGTNLGPTPYDFLGAALGSCTAMTLNMYARHKKIDLQSVSVDVTHSRVHADDCVECESSSGKVDVLKRKISLDGNLTAQQRERILQIADRCPVHKTLENEIHIVSDLVEEG